MGSLRCRSRPEYRSSWFVCRRSRHASFGFRLVRSWGIVNAYLYMVAAGCQGRQAIAVRCIDMSQRAYTVSIYPESAGFCTLHEKYQAFPFHLYGNFNIFSYILRCRSRDKSVSTGRLHWWDACRLPTCFHPSYRAMCSSLMNCSNFLINRFVLLLSGILFVCT